MRTGLFFRPAHAPRGDFDAFLEIATYADRQGIRSLEFGDHLAIGETERYPYGKWPHPPETPWYDPPTVLAAVAAVTSQIKLGTGVLLAGLRSPVVLAKIIATLDVISAGRVELGVGVGWQPEEYKAVGLEFKGRNTRLDEVVRICRELWGAQPVAAEGAGATLENVFAYPRPVQERLPILYGVAMSERNAARVARHADGWCPLELTPDDLARGVALLRDAFAECGRDPATVFVRMELPTPQLADGTPDVARAFAAIQEYRDAGLSAPVIAVPRRFHDLAEAHALIDAVVAAGSGS